LPSTGGEVCKDGVHKLATPLSQGYCHCKISARENLAHEESLFVSRGETPFETVEPGLNNSE